MTLAALGGPLASAADEASKAPKAILADAVRDLARVRTLHFRATQTDSGGRTKSSGDVSAFGSVDMKAAFAGVRVRIRVVDRHGFVKANEAYWLGGTDDGGPTPAELAGRWVKLPADSVITRSIRSLTPARMAQCLATVHGTLTKAGIERQDGRRAIVLEDAGDKPGTSPGRMYVTARGRVLPLRLVQTGRFKPGGRRNHCNEGGETILRSDTRLSAFDKPLNIQVPRDYIDSEKPPN